MVNGINLDVQRKAKWTGFISPGGIPNAICLQPFPVLLGETRPASMYQNSRWENDYMYLVSS